MTVKLARMGCRFVQVPIRYHPRTHREGKKIKYRDGAAAIVHLARARFFGGPVHPLPPREAGAHRPGGPTNHRGRDLPPSAASDVYEL